jgi:hypothetical protein
VRYVAAATRLTADDCRPGYRQGTSRDVATQPDDDGRDQTMPNERRALSRATIAQSIAAAALSLLLFVAVVNLLGA